MPKLGQILHYLTPCQNWGGLANCLSQNELQLLAVKMEVLDFQYLALFQNRNMSKDTCVGNRGHISHLLTTCWALFKRRKGLRVKPSPKCWKTIFHTEKKLCNGTCER